MKKKLFFLLYPVLFLLFFTNLLAQNNTTLDPLNTSTENNNTYTYLAPIANQSQFVLTEACPFGAYLGTIINIFLGILALLAMFMIVLGGVEYMSSELISSKQAGKDRMVNAVLGLLIALSAWLILETINPKLLDVCLNLAKT